MSCTQWNAEIIGIDPTRQQLAVAVVVPGRGATTGLMSGVLDRFRSWDWPITVLPRDLDGARLREAAAGHDVALFQGTVGNRRLRRALSADLPTVATVEPSVRGGVVRLLTEAGRRRTTTVLVIHRPTEARILRRISPAALVRLERCEETSMYAIDLAAVLLRARAWWR